MDILAMLQPSANAVTVKADEHGRVVIATKNPDFSYIRLEQVYQDFNESGWLEIKKKTTLLKGATESLDNLGLKAEQELPGKIVVIETLDPSDPEDGMRDIKYAGTSGVACSINDEPIYRRTFFDPTGTKTDSYLQHDNTAEIKTAQLIQKKVSVNKMPQLA